MTGGGFSACGAGIALSFAFDLLCVSNEATGSALLTTLSSAAGAEVSATISVTAGAEITVFFSGAGRGCAQQLEFSVRSKDLKLLIAMAPLVVLNHQMEQEDVGIRPGVFAQAANLMNFVQCMQTALGSNFQLN